MANKKITDLMSGTPTRDSLLESVVDINGTLDSRKVKAGAVADLASANVAAPYDSTVTYAIGQFCLYEGDIYRCIAITTGAFDSTAWTQIVVTGEFRRVVELTSAQYSALSSAEKNNGTLYVITDEETTADDIPYSRGVSVADKLNNVPTFDTLTSSDNNKLLVVSVSGSDISVGAVDVPTYEEGSSGNFKYRKWSDGTLEMWGYKEDTDTVTLVTWGSWYGCDFDGLGQYPIAFTSIHYINGNVVIDGYNGISSIVYPTTLTNAPAYIWDRGTTIASGTRRYRRYLYVKGTWN